MENTPTPAAAVADAPAPSFTEPVAATSSLPLAVIAGAVAAIVGASLWAGLTVLTERQFAYAAIGLGFLVGFGVRALGKGSTPTFGIVGAVFSLLGCALGNLLSIVGFLSKQAEISFFTALGHLNPETAMEMMKLTFEPIDLLFYGLAAFCGFKFSMLRGN